MDKEERELARAIEEIWEIGTGMGLDPFPIHFEIVPAGIMYEFGAYGLPGRFSHWTYGKAYEQMKTMYDHGLSKIYELVINTNPSYAFLLEGNSVLQNKLVAAHVMAHADFFKHNIYFSRTRRDMLETVTVDASRIRRYEDIYGRETVEAFLDAVLAIQEHVDPGLLTSTLPKAVPALAAVGGRKDPYEDLLGPGENPDMAEGGASKLPLAPEKDLLRFLSENAPDLEGWQRDIVSIVRQEMLYFLPQLQTKIMNEGWASYWHLRIMRELGLPEKDYIEFARLHSSVIATMPGRRAINPYAIGLKVLEEIERQADAQGQNGRELIFEVRELECDQSFLRNHLSKDLVDTLDLYTYEQRDEEWVVADRNWEHVRDQLVDSMTNLGHPTIKVEDGNYEGKRELLLKHYYEGRELDFPYAERALRHVFALWGHPVHLETVRHGRPVLMSYDGEENSAVELGVMDPMEPEADGEPIA